MLYVHILLVAPLDTGNMARSGADEHEGRVAIRESAYNTGSAANFLIQTLNAIVGADTQPMLIREIHVGQCFSKSSPNLLCSFFQFHPLQVLNDLFCFLSSGSFVLLGVDGLEHLSDQLHFAAGDCGENIAVKVNRASLVFCLRIDFSHSFQHTQTLISNDQLDAVQTASFQLLKEADPAGLVLLHSLSGTQNFTVTVLVDTNGDQNGNVLKLTAPVAAQIDAIQIDIRIFAAPQGAVMPIFDVNIRFLVQLADGGWRYLCAS